MAAASPARAARPAPHLDVILLLAVLVVGDGEAQGVSGTFDQHQGGALGQRESAIKHGRRGAGADLRPSPSRPSGEAARVISGWSCIHPNSGPTKKSRNAAWGTWQARMLEPKTLDLGVVTLSPTLGEEIT